MLENNPAIRKVLIGAFIAGAGAATVYAAEFLPGVVASEHGALWGAMAATAINAIRQMLLALSRESEDAVPKE